MQSLGQSPADPERNRQWQAQVAIVAAYREQFKVTTDDPAHILGPHAEPGTPARKPYWHAAESVIAARRLGGLEVLANAEVPSAWAQVAIDVYRMLPKAERSTISREIAARLGPLWFGSPTAPDDEAVAHSDPRFRVGCSTRRLWLSGCGRPSAA
jgi:hypothetical protein